MKKVLKTIRENRLEKEAVYMEVKKVAFEQKLKQNRENCLEVHRSYGIFTFRKLKKDYK